MKIYDTFYISLLRLTSNDFFIKQIQSSSSLIVIKEKNKYKINDILDNQYHYEKLQYKIAWTNHASNRTWYSAKNFLNHSKEILDDYYRRYFIKFELKMRRIAIIKAILSQWIKKKHKKTKQLIQNVLNRMKTKMKKNDRKRFNKDSFEKNLKSTFINIFDRLN
jgi:predicted metal-dependent hydrolase